MKEITSTELKSLIKESVHRILMEMNGEFDSSISQAIDECINIIIKTECAGRGFDFGNNASIDNDEKYLQLKQELLESMESYFNSAKVLLNYLSQICTDDYTKQKCMKYLEKNFTPTWH